MEFRLTYEDPIHAASTRSPRTDNKHTLRRAFHKQLKQLWETHPYLKVAWLSRRREGRVLPGVLLKDHLAKQYDRLGYNFVPLVTESLSLWCSLDILFLRPSMPGEIMKSGDLDNRLKIIFDALRLPDSLDELGSAQAPLEDEKPFFCLLQDDKLISRVSVETDTLLEPTSPNAGDNDARLVIAIKLKPVDVGWDNISFG